MFIVLYFSHHHNQLIKGRNRKNNLVIMTFQVKSIAVSVTRSASAAIGSIPKLPVLPTASEHIFLATDWIVNE